MYGGGRVEGINAEHSFLKNKTSQQKSAAEADIAVVVSFWRVHFFTSSDDYFCV